MTDSEFEARVLISLKWEIFRFGKKKSLMNFISVKTRKSGVGLILIKFGCCFLKQNLSSLDWP